MAKQNEAGLVELHEAKRMLSNILRREDVKPVTFARALSMYGQLCGWDNETPSPVGAQ